MFADARVLWIERRQTVIGKQADVRNGRSTDYEAKARLSALRVDTLHTNPPIYSLQYPGALLAVIRACEVDTIAS